MKKTYTKYIFSSIKQDLSRLISIFVIVVLGLGFLVGLKSTSPDLRATMNQYYNDMNFMDVYIQSTIGFSDSDVETLRSELSGVSQIEGYYQMDEFTYIDNKKSETRLIYRTFENNSIDKITLVDGEFPDNENEVLLLNNSSDTISHKIGTEIRITNDDGTEETYTVSGLVDDPFYISRNGDVTTIGSGVLDAVVYFDSSFYEPKETTIIKIRYAGARQFNSFSQEYKDFIDRKIDEINEISAPFLENRVAEIKEMMKDEAAEQIRTQFEEAINNSEFSDEIKQGLIDALEKFLETEEFDALVANQIEQTFEEQFGSIDTTWYVLSREENQGAYMFEQDSGKVDAVSAVFPVFFFVIALLVSVTSVTRIINKDRGQMGTLKSLGYSKGMIYTKYLIYGLLTTILGSIVAILFGLFVLPTIIGYIYGTLYDIVGPIVYIGDPATIALYTFLMIALILLTITIIAFASLRDNVSSLLIGKAPVPGKKIWLEHIPFIWKHLKFNTKSMLRNVFRFKKNLIMMLIGIGGCTGLLLTSFGIKDSLSVINTTQYTEIIKYDFVAKLTDEGMNGDNIFDVGNSTKAYYYDGEALGADSNIDMSLIATNSLPEYVGLDDPLSFDSSSFIITKQIADEFNLSVGDNLVISLDDLNNSLTQIRITGITQNYIGNYVYCGEEIMKNYFPSLSANAYIVDTGLSDEEVNAYIDQMLENPLVTSIINSQNTKLVYESVLNNLDALVVIIVLLSGALIAVVIYNLTDIMVSERVKEIATLRVNGYYRYEALLYIFREIFFMTIIGVAIGIGVGVFLHNYIMNSISSVGLTFGMAIAWPSYIYTILLALGFVLLVCVLFFPKINKIKMAEALKSVE